MTSSPNIPTTNGAKPRGTAKAAKTTDPARDLREVPAPPPGEVRKAGRWTVGTGRDGEPFALKGRCRHQLADLSKGRVDADGCLVCPWHASRFDVRTGRMVDGPKGMLWYRGPTPGYSAMILAYAKHLPLRVGRAVRKAGSVIVG